MAYRVKLTAPAEADIYAAYEYIWAAAPHSAEKWLRELFLFIDTLDEMPTRCPLIAEAEELGYPARQLLYGKQTGTYRIIFDIQEITQEGPQVRILRVWHGSRDAITAQDIETDS